MVVFRAAVASMFMLLGACSVGEVPLGGGNPDGGTDSGGGTGAQTFDQMIKPLVAPRCTNCHSGNQKPNLTSFAALEAQYKMKPGTGNLLVTKAGDGADHHGTPYFSAADKTTVANWIQSLP